MITRIVLASNNPGKLAELQAMFAPLGVELVAQGALGIPEADEPFYTFVENALAKARHASRISGLPAIADDAGLCVEAFGGLPGVDTAFYALKLGYPKGDEHNVTALLAQMRDVTDRRAALVSTLVALRSAKDPEPLIAVGRAPGEITAKRDYDRLEMQRFMARHGIDSFKMNPHFPVNTLLIMRGAVAAQELGLTEAYNEAMFAGMWEQGLKLDLPDVWHRAMIAAGLPADALAKGAGDDAVKQQLASNTASAVERGAFGSPTFFLGEAMWFGKERLRDVEQAAAIGR